MPFDDSIPLGPDDADADLARRLSEGQEPSFEDPFERVLAEYKQRAVLSVPSPPFSDRLWNKVAPTGDPSFRFLPVWVRWAAAAAATLLITLAGWLASSTGPKIHSAARAEIAVVDLDDGSVVTLRPRTTLYRLASHHYLLEGEAFFDVASDPRRTFRVRSALGEIRVLGTRFDVSTWGGNTTVFLERGRVLFEHLPTGTVDTLAAGDELVASSTSLSVRPAQRSGEAHIDWLDQLLVFDERPLSIILAELEHHFGIKVVVPDSVKNETLSGRIQLSGPNQSLADLGVVLGARFKESPPNVFYLLVD